MILILVWLGAVVVSGAMIVLFCALFGDRDVRYAVVPQAAAVILRPAALERGDTNMGMQQKEKRMARGDGPETWTTPPKPATA